MSRSREYTVFNGDDEQRSWEVETLENGRYRVTKPDGETIEVDAIAPDDDRLHLLVEGKSVDAALFRRDSTYQVQIDEQRHDIEVLNERELRMRAAEAVTAGGGSPQLVSPMAGLVVKVDAEVGQTVEAGDRIVVVEAMKMENDLEAHRSGVIEEIPVQAGDSVEIDDVLAVIGEPDDE